MTTGGTGMKYVKQHLIDPVACIRCNSCLESCPNGAIDFDGGNYIVDAAVCDFTEECMAGCPTGAIGNGRMVPEGQTFSLAEQAAWSDLPPVQLSAPPAPRPDLPRAPWSAAQPWRTPYTAQAPALARVKANVRLTAPEGDSDIHHIVLDFGAGDWRVLEGQTVSVLPPGTDAQGRPHHVRPYSVASARDGETPGTKEVALTVKRVVDEWQGQPHRGVASDYLCNLAVGDTVRCVGPLGISFLLPGHPGTKWLMVGTGTGIAPMRGFIQYRSRKGRQAGDAMVLVYGGRTEAEMAYLDELRAVPELLSLHVALSRDAERPKQYVQDVLWQQRETLAPWLTDENAFIYVCGLKGMEAGVLDTLRAIAEAQGLDWTTVHNALRAKARLHIETY